MLVAELDFGALSSLVVTSESNVSTAAAQLVTSVSYSDAVTGLNLRRQRDLDPPYIRRKMRIAHFETVSVASLKVTYNFPRVDVLCFHHLVHVASSVRTGTISQ